MKFLHLGDLHIGKRLNNISLLEDQRYILGQILDIAREERPDAVLIAGDVYDRTLPPAEAVTLLDDFLTALAGEKIPVFLISGNHDSAERLAFGGRLLSEGGVYLSPVYDGELTPHLLEDEYGTVAVWLLPFIRPAHVRAVYPRCGDHLLYPGGPDGAGTGCSCGGPSGIGGASVCHRGGAGRF